MSQTCDFRTDECPIGNGAPLGLITAMVVAVLLFILLGIIGNCVLFAILQTETWMKRSIYRTQTTLVLLDIGYLLLRTVFELYTLGRSYFPKYTALVSSYVPSYFLLQLSFVFSRLGKAVIALIVVERTSVIWFPLKKIWTTGRTTIIMVVTLAFIACVISYDPMHSFLYYNAAESHNASLDLQNELQNYLQKRLQIRTYLVANRFCFDILPVLIVMIGTPLMITGIRKSTNAISSALGQTAESRLAKERQLSRTLIVISVTFAALCFPADICEIKFLFSHQEDHMEGTSGFVCAVANLLITVNHSINFVLYGISNKIFRKRLKAICCH